MLMYTWLTVRPTQPGSAVDVAPLGLGWTGLQSDHIARLNRPAERPGAWVTLHIRKARDEVASSRHSPLISPGGVLFHHTSADHDLGCGG